MYNSDPDYEHQEQQDAMTEWEAGMRQKISEGAPKAAFHYTDSDLRPEEGWLIGTEFFFQLRIGGYTSYSMQPLVAGFFHTQYICTGAGPVPIGYAVLDEVSE